MAELDALPSSPFPSTRSLTLVVPTAALVHSLCSSPRARPAKTLSPPEPHSNERLRRRYIAVERTSQRTRRPSRRSARSRGRPRLRRSILRRGKEKKVSIASTRTKREEAREDVRLPAQSKLPSFAPHFFVGQMILPASTPDSRKPLIQLSGSVK